MRLRQYNAACTPVRLLIVSSLVLALLCVAAADSIEHFHRDAESAATCRICQIAHIPIAPVKARLALSAPTWTSAETFLDFTNFYFAPLLSLSQSRGPPAEFAR